MPRVERASPRVQPTIRTSFSGPSFRTTQSGIDVKGGIDGVGVIGGEGAGGRKAEGADEEAKVQVVVRGQSQMMGKR